MSARDIRYGRRGGGWIDEPAPDRPDTTGNVTATCSHCHNPFRASAPRPGEPAPTCCGKQPCWELAYWSPAEWEGAARMARTRIAAGIPLTTFDHLALERAA